MSDTLIDIIRYGVGVVFFVGSPVMLWRFKKDIDARSFGHPPLEDDAGKNKAIDEWMNKRGGDYVKH